MFRVRLVLALMAAVAAAGLVKCAHGGGGADFVPNLSVGDKWSVAVSWTIPPMENVPKEESGPDMEVSRTIDYEVKEIGQVEDSEGKEVTAYKIRVSGVGSTGGYAELLVRKDTFTLVKWSRMNSEGKVLSKESNKPSNATFTSTVQPGDYNQIVWVDFPLFPAETKNETRKLKYHRSLEEGEPDSEVVQETKFTGNIMEITITAKSKSKKTQRKVYIKWEKGKKWWSESAKWELDKDGKEVKYSRHTAKLVENP